MLISLTLHTVTSSQLPMGSHPPGCLHHPPPQLAAGTSTYAFEWWILWFQFLVLVSLKRWRVRHSGGLCALRRLAFLAPSSPCSPHQSLFHERVYIFLWPPWPFSDRAPKTLSSRWLAAPDTTGWLHALPDTPSSGVLLGGVAQLSALRRTLMCQT